MPVTDDCDADTGRQYATTIHREQEGLRRGGRRMRDRRPDAVGVVLRLANHANAPGDDGGPALRLFDLYGALHGELSPLIPAVFFSMIHIGTTATNCP